MLRNLPARKLKRRRKKIQLNGELSQDMFSFLLSFLLILNCETINSESMCILIKKKKEEKNRRRNGEKILIRKRAKIYFIIFRRYFEKWFHMLVVACLTLKNLHCGLGREGEREREKIREKVEMFEWLQK